MRYYFNKSEYGTHQLIANEIGTGKKVLDVGCNTGYLKKLSAANEFYGLDFNKKYLKVAKANGYEETYFSNLNQDTPPKISEKFDVLVFADVLEHLLDPSKVLRFFLKKNLTKNGLVIISLPNVANVLIRFKLLLGKFNYTENGILDSSHLHLYTAATARKFISTSGLLVIKELASSNRFGRLFNILPSLRRLLGHSLIFICKVA